MKILFLALGNFMADTSVRVWAIGNEEFTMEWGYWGGHDWISSDVNGEITDLLLESDFKRAYLDSRQYKMWQFLDNQTIQSKAHFEFRYNFDKKRKLGKV